jgi:hypothetical protein
MTRLNLILLSVLVLLAARLIVLIDAFAKDSSLATYTNDAYVISFRYPADLVLKEGAAEGEKGEDMPHGHTIVSLSNNSYPVSFSVSVDTISPESDCKIFYSAPQEQGLPDVRIGEIRFSQASGCDVWACKQDCDDIYRVFRNRSCYELTIEQWTHCDMTKEQESNF